MKPAKLSTPDRDVGRPSIQPLMRGLIDRIESIEQRLAKQDGSPAVSLQAERSLLSRLDVHAGDAVTLEQKRIMRRALDEEYFRRELSAGHVVYEGAVAEVKNGDETCMRFVPAAAGVNAHAQLTVEGRALWARTRPRLSVWFTSDANGTALFSFRFVVRAFPAGGSTTSAVFVTDFTAAGPAAAGTVLSATVVGGAIMPALQGPVQIRVGRLGGDANANNLDVLLAVVAFEEVA